VAQSAKRPPLDFDSGHDLSVMRPSLVLDSALGMEPAWNSLSPFPSALPLPCPLLTLSKKEKEKKVRK